MQPSEKAWERDKRRADIFMAAVRIALAKHVILVGSIDEDREEGTDLVVLRTDRKSIGVRIRDASKYFEKYRLEVTIRKSRPSGAKTELAKLEEGWIDLIFYGFGDFDTGTLRAYRIIDCKAWRAQMIRREPELKFKDKPNFDGTQFRAYDTTSFAPGVEIEKWCDPNLVQAVA